MLKNLNYYMTIPYTIDVVYEKSGKAPPYVARILELPGCMAQGRNHNDAVRELREAQTLFIEAMLEKPRSYPGTCVHFGSHGDEGHLRLFDPREPPQHVPSRNVATGSCLKSDLNRP